MPINTNERLKKCFNISKIIILNNINEKLASKIYLLLCVIYYIITIKANLLIIY